MRIAETSVKHLLSAIAIPVRVRQRCELHRPGLVGIRHGRGSIHDVLDIDLRSQVELNALFPSCSSVPEGQ